jgi:hypothetical protein
LFTGQNDIRNHELQQTIFIAFSYCTKNKFNIRMGKEGGFVENYCTDYFTCNLLSLSIIEDLSEICGQFNNLVPLKTRITRWFKYDRNYLCVNKSQFVPVIFEPPCI